MKAWYRRLFKIIGKQGCYIGKLILQAGDQYNGRQPKFHFKYFFEKVLDFYK